MKTKRSKDYKKGYSAGMMCGINKKITLSDINTCAFNNDKLRKGMYYGAGLLQGQGQSDLTFFNKIDSLNKEGLGKYFFKEFTEQMKKKKLINKIRPWNGIKKSERIIIINSITKLLQEVKLNIIEVKNEKEMDIHSVV